MRIFWLSFAALAIFAQSVFALEFSADMVSTGGGRSFTGKIYVSNDKIRMDAAGTITITRMDKDVTWVIMPGQDMYIEQAVKPENIAGSAEKMPGEIERKFLSSETVDGRPADKYRIIYTSGSAKAVIFQWMDKASGIPVKTEAEDGSWTVEYRNLNIGSQPSEMFEVPAGCKKFAMPNMGDMMKRAAEGSMQD